jgi:hypothetical protein
VVSSQVVRLDCPTGNNTQVVVHRLSADVPAAQLSSSAVLPDAEAQAVLFPGWILFTCVYNAHREAHHGQSLFLVVVLYYGPLFGGTPVYGCFHGPCR